MFWIIMCSPKIKKCKKKQFIMPLVMNFSSLIMWTNWLEIKAKGRHYWHSGLKIRKEVQFIYILIFFSFEIIYEWSSSEASEKKIQNIRFQEEVLIFLHYFSISRASTVHYWGALELFRKWRRQIGFWRRQYVMKRAQHGVYENRIF